MTIKTALVLGAILLAAGLGAGIVWRFAAPSSLDSATAKIDQLLVEKKTTDSAVADLTREIQALRTQARQDTTRAGVGVKKADAIAQESALLAARVTQLEDAWRGFSTPRSLAEAIRQLTTSADLIRAYQTELQANASEILQLREVVTLLTSANTKQEIALARADAREELRKELIDRFDAELRGLREDLAAERKQRARERWMSLVPLIGAALLLFSGGFGG